MSKILLTWCFRFGSNRVAAPQNKSQHCSTTFLFLQPRNYLLCLFFCVRKEVHFIDLNRERNSASNENNKSNLFNEGDSKMGFDCLEKESSRNSSHCCNMRNKTIVIKRISEQIWNSLLVVPLGRAS